MDGRGFTADLFGKGTGGTLRLVHPVEARVAVLQNERTATCEGVTVIADQAVTALCGALAAIGVADSALQVRSRTGEAVCFIDSIHSMARDGTRRA